MKKKLSGFLFAVAILFAAPNVFAQVSVGVGLNVRIAPPEIPVYTQPPCPTDGYLWQPGYWAYDDADGYYWVPGVWVAPPNPGLLWTPPYWGFSGGYYGFHAGYWGPHVGFYGGINYGFGYGGIGFGGGIWVGNSFRYNTAVFNVNRTVIHNTYVDRTVVRGGGSRVSFNGPGGINRQPTPGERQAMSERHFAPTRQQMAHQQAAHNDPGQRFSANHGAPAHAAASRVSAHGFGQAAHGGGVPEAHNMNAAGRPNAPQGNQGNAMRYENHATPQQHAAQPQQHMQAAQHNPQPQHAPSAPHGGGGMPHGGGAPHGGGGAPHGGGGGHHH